MISAQLHRGPAGSKEGGRQGGRENGGEREKRESEWAVEREMEMREM